MLSSESAAIRRWVGGGWGGDSPVLLWQKETWSADHPAPLSMFLPHCTFTMYIGAIYNMCSNNPYDMHRLLISEPYQQSQMSPLSGFSWKQEFWSENIDLQTECSEQTRSFISPENFHRKAENLAEFCLTSHESQKIQIETLKTSKIGCCRWLLKILIRTPTKLRRYLKDVFDWAHNMCLFESH